MGRILALDHGQARCGCAVSDPSATLATPVDPVPRPESRRGMRRIAELVAEQDVQRVIVGLPLSLAGADSDQTQQARVFAARLARRLGPDVPVDLVDERFTTAQARRQRGMMASEDSRAAAVLLEGWLAGAGGESARRAFNPGGQA